MLFDNPAGSEGNGEIQFNTEYAAKKKPLWLLSLKLLGLTVMVTLGYVLLIPSLPFEWWQSIAGASGIIMLYVGIAFFVRPEPNTDNMGMAGGLMNDPTQAADNWNRMLFNLHCFLGPGRFISETVLDTFTALGMVPDEEESLEEKQIMQELQQCELKQSVVERLERRAAQGHQGVQQLATASLLNPDRFEDE